MCLQYALMCSLVQCCYVGLSCPIMTCFISFFLSATDEIYELDIDLADTQVVKTLHRQKSRVTWVTVAT